jgi:hypothetical protein
VLRFGSNTVRLRLKLFVKVNFLRRRISKAVATFAQRLAEKERQRLAAGYHRDAEQTEKRKKCLTELYWLWFWEAGAFCSG